MINRASESDITRVIELIYNRYGNVENKSSAAIRDELTSYDIVRALGYTPADNSSGIESAFDEDEEIIESE